MLIDHFHLKEQMRTGVLMRLLQKQFVTVKIYLLIQAHYIHVLKAYTCYKMMQSQYICESYWVSLKPHLLDNYKLLYGTSTLWMKTCWKGTLIA